jgi:molybdenum cofactor biosynthesis enzyme MoaA
MATAVIKSVRRFSARAWVGRKIRSFLVVNSCDGAYDSLDVRFTKACPNRCSFCVEKEGVADLGMASPEAMAAATLDTGIGDVLIVGGEPLLFPERVRRYAELIRPRIEKIYLTSSLPEAAANRIEEVFGIVELLDGLNVSLASVDDEENNAIMRSPTPNHRVTAALARLARRFPDKVRVNLNLVRGGIDTGEKLVDSLRKLGALGVRRLRSANFKESRASTSRSTSCSMGRWAQWRRRHSPEAVNGSSAFRERPQRCASWPSVPVF